MIITVTPNPSIDRTIFVPALSRGQVVRGLRDQREPSGKGVNVALALHAAGHSARAILPVGGAGGEEIRVMLDDLGLSHVAVPIETNIRSNLSIVEPDGTVTKVNERGPMLEPKELDALIDAAFEDVADVTWVAGCGSCPPGDDGELYQTLIREARHRGLKSAVDTSGSALRAVLSAGPDLVKPNVDELAEAVGIRPETFGDVIDACDDLRARGAAAVLASLGADGALLVDDQGPLHGYAPVDSVVSAVGAGDVLLAGFLSQAGARENALRTALAWAAAATQQPGTLFRLPRNSFPVTVSPAIDRSRRLSGVLTNPVTAVEQPHPTISPSEGLQ